MVQAHVDVRSLIANVHTKYQGLGLTDAELDLLQQIADEICRAGGGKRVTINALDKCPENARGNQLAEIVAVAIVPAILQ